MFLLIFPPNLPAAAAAGQRTHARRRRSPARMECARFRADARARFGANVETVVSEEACHALYYMGANPWQCARIACDVGWVGMWCEPSCLEVDGRVVVNLLSWPAGKNIRSKKRKLLVHAGVLRGRSRLGRLHVDLGRPQLDLATFILAPKGPSWAPKGHLGPRRGPFGAQNCPFGAQRGPLGASAEARRAPRKFHQLQ